MGAVALLGHAAAAPGSCSTSSGGGGTSDAAHSTHESRGRALATSDGSLAEGGGRLRWAGQRHSPSDGGVVVARLGNEAQGMYPYLTTTRLTETLQRRGGHTPPLVQHGTC